MPLHNPLRLLLVVSLAVNIFAVGAFAAHWFSVSWRSDSSAPQPNQSGRSQVHAGIVVGLPRPSRLLDVLTEEERAALMADWRRQNPKLRRQFGTMYDARDDVAETLSQSDYSRAELEAAFAALRKRQMELASTSQGLIVNLADMLDAEGRERLAEILRPPPDRPWQNVSTEHKEP